MKKIILTGGSDGLGKAFGMLCRANDIEVVCLSRTAPSYDAVHIKTDLSDEGSIQASVDEILAKHNPFDALVNCAGVYSSQNPDEISYSELDRVIKINTIAPAFLASRLFNTIKDNQADILNVGSTIGTRSSPDQLVYGASKWSLRGISLNLRMNLRKTKSRVILFSPGGVKTNITRKFDDKGVDTSEFMEPKDLAVLMLQILQLPKSIEVSEILINRKDR